MAIKGKKKNRGSAGARRPAGAPRPVIEQTKRKRSFWRSRDGILILSVFALVGIGTVVWLIGEARSGAQERDEQRAVLSQYGDRVEPILITANDPAEEMTLITQLPAEGELEDLGSDVEKWTAALQEAQIQLTQVFPGPGVQPINQLFNEGLALYTNAASLLGQITTLDVSDDERVALFGNFTTQRDLATALFESAIGAYNELRDQLDMDGSSLRPPVPSGMNSGQQPGGSSTEVEIPTQEGEGGSDG